MVHPHEKGSSARIGAAARRLFEGERSAAAGTDHRGMLIVVNRIDDAQLERCAFDAALDAGVPIVALRFGHDRGAMPRRANVALLHGGVPLEMRNCVLWSGADDGRALLVPWDAREDRHFGVGPAGLEVRPGRPAKMLGQGMSRAKARLERLVRSLRQDELGQSMTILSDPEDIA